MISRSLSISNNLGINNRSVNTSSPPGRIYPWNPWNDQPSTSLTQRWQSIRLTLVLRHSAVVKLRLTASITPTSSWRRLSSTLCCLVTACRRPCRCAQCGRQGEGDPVQPGVSDQPGRVPRTAGRPTQPRHRRFPARQRHSFSSSQTRLITGLFFRPAGVAVALKQAMTAEFKAYQTQVLANCRALSAALIDHGYKIVTGNRSPPPPAT